MDELKFIRQGYFTFVQVMKNMKNRIKPKFYQKLLK